MTNALPSSFVVPRLPVTPVEMTRPTAGPSTCAACAASKPATLVGPTAAAVAGAGGAALAEGDPAAWGRPGDGEGEAAWLEQAARTSVASSAGVVARRRWLISLLRESAVAI